MLTYIENHKWTVAALAGAVVILIVVIVRRRNATAAANSTSAQSGLVYSTSDPNQLAANVQLQQAQLSSQTQLAAIGAQGAVQVQLAQIGANAQNVGVAATQDVTNQQTQAQLALGLGTLQSQVALAQISADVQMSYIQAIIDAFRGTSSPVATGSSGVTTDNGGLSQNTANVVPITSYPIYTAGTGASPNTPHTSAPAIPASTAGATIAKGAAPVAGGTPFVSPPAYTPVGAWPDAGTVAANVGAQVDYTNVILADQTQNNQNQCYVNAALSQGKPNYESLMAACAAGYGGG